MVDVAQLVRAHDCGSWGRGFESPHPPHLNTDLYLDFEFCVYLKLYKYILDSINIILIE